jgi:hypothetical protein
VLRQAFQQGMEDSAIPQQQHLLINVLQIFDLKGSTRNRHVQSTGRENEVLLDENLVECKFKSTFPVLDKFSEHQFSGKY